VSYDDLAPFYDEIERRLGVQGDVAAMPAATLAQAPRRHQFVMPPNPPMYAGSLFAEGAAALGYHAYPFPMAINSGEFDGRPRCNSCGFCSGFGCPINARGLRRAQLPAPGDQGRRRVAAPDLRVPDRPHARGTAARGVSYLDEGGKVHREEADVVIVAAPRSRRLASSCSRDQSCRSPAGLGNRSGQLGRT